MEGQLKGKVAIVTGASRGIGAAIAVKLASMGAHVAINYRVNSRGAEDVAEKASSYGVKAVPVKADVSVEDEVKDMVKLVYRELGPPLIVVNNAGVGRASPLLESQTRHFDLQVNVNLKGTYLVTRETVRYMIEARWGRIINVSSIAGITGLEYLSVYSMTKAGIIGFTRSLAVELAKYNITVNAVAPGFVMTDMGSSFFEWIKVKYGQDVLEDFKSRIPSGMFASPNDVANAVGFLASPEASGITGHVIPVDWAARLSPGYVGLKRL